MSRMSGLRAGDYDCLSVRLRSLNSDSSDFCDCRDSVGGVLGRSVVVVVGVEVDFRRTAVDLAVGVLASGE